MKIGNSEIRIGISSCLLGSKVRYDAGHKHDRYITDVFGAFVKFVPVCPELEVGMGVPREAVRLVGDLDNPSMVGRESNDEWTEPMNEYSKKRVLKSDFKMLSGFILKSKSPSCGMERVKVYLRPDYVSSKGVGLFARVLLETYPDLPVEEEGRLNDAGLRENFIERVFAYRRLGKLFEEQFSKKEMIDFHARHKYMLLAHSPQYYRKLGQLVAKIKDYKPEQFKAEYRELFMTALKYKATVKKNTNVLQHIAGFLKKQISEKEKLDIHQSISDYHQELVPLIVPITLLKHFVEKYDIEYIKNQYYLNPHPKELMLRNHV